MKLFLKGDRCYTDKCAIERRNYPPGQHGQGRRRKVSEYAVQLREKQRLKRMYGLMESQFRKYFEMAEVSRDITGEVLLNLLENAFRYSPPRCPVGLHQLESADGALQLTVWDAGDPIPLEEQQIIFERGQRGSRGAQLAGTGLGLALARDLARGLGFGRIIELQTWESFSHDDWRVTLTPAKHWGARTLHDDHRGYGGFMLEHQGRKIYHAGDSAYFDGFKEIGTRCTPEIALLPIGAYYPDSFRQVHMGPDEAMQVFNDLGAEWFIPMHFGSFKLSFEALDAPPRWLKEIARKEGKLNRVRILEEGVPVIF